MVVDTGADECFFDHQLAYTIGVNPLDGGRVSEVQGLGSSQPTATFPIALVLPEFDVELALDAHFSPIQGGWNGLLGHRGFLDQFASACFYPGSHFELTR